MITSGQKLLPTIGFLTIIRDPDHGLFGGYLVLNALGRPCEFHCTAPVRPNRAQEILYGPTLEPYLYGECITPVLLQKTKTKPLAVLTDIPPVLAARPFVGFPLLLLVEYLEQQKDFLKKTLKVDSLKCLVQKNQTQDFWQEFFREEK